MTIAFLNAAQPVATDSVIMATVWLRRWVDMGPEEPADGEQISLEVQVFGVNDLPSRLKTLSKLLHPGWTFDGWHVPWVELEAEPDPF